MIGLIKDFHYKSIVRKKYKFELLKDVHIVEPILFKGWQCEHEFFSIQFGVMVIKTGYAWDGCTGGLITNDPTNIEASLFHDALSQAMREGLVKANYSNRKRADKIFLKLLKINKTPFIKRTLCYVAVRLAGWAFTYF